MKEALSLPDERLQNTTSKNFNLDIIDLKFIPMGESSWLYKARTNKGDEVALKVQRNINPAVDEARRLLVQQNYNHAPQVYLTVNGQVQAPMGELYVSIEDYIDHHDIKAYNAMPDASYLALLGKSLRELHGLAPPDQKASQIPVETFNPMYRKPTQQMIMDFKEWATSKDIARPTLDLLTNKAQIIEDLFARSVKLGINLAAQDLPLYLTHGDVHFANTIEATDGKLYLIDWDNAMMARPAHDLMYFTDEQIVGISAGYGQDLLATPDELAYYRNHLMLRAVWFWLSKLMQSNSSIDFKHTASSLITIFDDSPYLLRALGNSEIAK